MIVINEAIENLRKRLSEIHDPESKTKIEAEINAREKMELISRQISRKLQFAEENGGA